jgi:ubiquinone/menaquinone biosynthesis C-methylase UbiE
MNESKIAAPTFGKTHGGNAAENYERWFVPVIGRPLAVDLIEASRLRPGERVLDVACGTGIVARLALEDVGPGGTVSALDLTPAMLEVARALPGGSSIRWYETSAESIPLPDAMFDVVFCQLGLQFVPDKDAALREMRRVLVEDGRLAMNVPGPTEFFDVLERALERHAGPSAAGFVRMVFSLHDPHEIERRIQGAGFRDVVVHSEKKALLLPAPDEFLWQYVRSTPLAGVLADAPAAVREGLEREIVENWRPWTSAEGTHSEQIVITAMARK